MDITWITTAILGFILLYVIYYWLNSIYNHWDSKGIKNLKTIPYLGMAMNLLVYRKNLNELVDDLYAGLSGHRFGGYIQIGTPGIFLRDPELIYRIMISDFSHFEDRNLPTTRGGLLNYTLASLTGDKWRSARHKLTPTFTSGKLKHMFDCIKECSSRVVDHLKDKTHSDIETRDLLYKYVLSVVGDVAFGMKVDTFDPESQESIDFVKACRKLLNPSLSVLIKILISATSPKLHKLLKFNVIDSEIENYFRNLVKDLIYFRETTGTKRNDFLQIMLDQRKAEKTNDTAKNKLNSEIITSDSHESEDLVLLQHLNSTPPSSKEDLIEFTDEFIAAQSFVFLVGGTENTVNMLGFTLFELAANLEWQRKVQQEISSVVSEDGFNYQSLSKMKYMDQVLYETFRLHTPGGLIFRICTKEYLVPDTNFVIEKGTLLMIPTVSLHKDPEYFSDPESFKPERFEDMDSIKKGTFNSFGAGPRMCIAMRFALLEMKILLVTLLSSYNISLSKKTSVPLKLKMNAITPQVDGGIWVQFEKRST